MSWLLRQRAQQSTRLGIALFTAGMAACSLPLSEKVAEVSNHCTGDSDCGDSGRCIETICVATQADLGELVIEIEVPAGASIAPNTTHVIKPKNQGLNLSGASGGFFEFKDLDLTELIDLEVSLEVQNIPAVCGGLADAAGRVPIRVELNATRAAFGTIPAGVATRIYDATTQTGAADKLVAMKVPGGAYDVYITPLVGDREDPDNPFKDCFLSPRLLRDRSINDGVIADVVVYDEEKPAVVGSVAGFDLEGWSVALIENKKGRLMSETDLLTLSETASTFQLSYWAENDQEDLDIVLRLTPPPDRTVSEGLPVFYWKLSGLPGNAANVGKLAEAQPIPVSGTVVDENYNVTVPSILTIHSNELFLDFGENVVYRRTIETDADGGFGGISLLPGDYTVIIQPVTGDSLAVTKGQIVLNPGNMGQGITLPVMRKRQLDGVAFTVQGVGAPRINAVLEPVVPSSTTFLQNVRDTISVPLSSATTLTDTLGQFSLFVDPGKFNFSLRPPSNSDLPWAVVSSYTINETDTPLDDISLQIPNPVILIGQVRTEGTTVANARIRAWLQPATPLDGEGTPLQPTSVQIAETTSLENGSYRLLLPGSLATLSR